MFSIPKGSKIYISGPIEAIADRNNEGFKKAWDFLLDEGYEPISPLNNFAGEGHKHKRSENMTEDYMSIILADAVYLLKGFHKSPGCQDEIRCALNCGKPIFYEEGC